MGIFINDELRQKKAASFAKGRILDIGFAMGPNKFLKGKITGYDLEKPKKLPNNYYNYIQDDIKNIKKHFKPKSFNTIIALEFIEHIEEHITFFKTCHNFLKKDGLLILSTPTPFYYKTLIGNIFFMKGYSGIKDHVSIYIPRIFNNIAKEIGFELVDIKPATKIYIPFFTWQLIYIYKKIKN